MYVNMYDWYLWVKNASEVSTKKYDTDIYICRYMHVIEEELRLTRWL